MKKHYDVAIIGAGAAGLFCAGILGQAGLRVLLLDNGKKIGRKILMSGGGFCNFTNLDVSAEHYLCQNPHFVKSALARFTQWDFIALVNQYHIAYHEKERGQLFCDHGASEIVQLLQSECEKGQVEIALREIISGVEYQQQHFMISGNQRYMATHLVVATGGLSMPKLGATPFGYQLAEQFSLEVLSPRASLVPFTFREQDRDLAELAGVSLPVIVQAKSGMQFHHQLLFTHRGLSGPAMLQISNYWQPTEPLHIDLLPQQSISTMLLALRQHSPKQQLKTALCHILPKRLVALWEAQQRFANVLLANISNAQLTALEQLVHQWQFQPNGTEGYRSAEVTLGGVNTTQISSKTMQAVTQPNLYFIGEVLDVTGWLGGYNFQWAWSSAYACAQGIIAQENYAHD
ncbi:BaiN/RdsA family NAD(P)/FAD-dependent oxidoreductase [Spirabiliibacterium falconis]|uniref:NAD(P)/FAD-dependent oxidoreductase n=1 Tax=Spirabiliibacterium falconis TaxID=572023 RepID=UPI001AADC421|nr:NAD(P)/FAD-dependent oxidoreductase [Spirabiliibacterium falconis]MBE2895223.1 NAD(P)/FAD-dependent oxidoreductase [Spirabiliibacterium falconis]